MSRRKLVMLLGPAFVLLLFVTAHFGLRTPARRSLPWSATDIREHSVDMFVDYSYYLRARIDEDEFRGYAKRLGVSPGAATQFHMDTGNRDLPEWWTTGANRGEVFARQIGDDYLAATYDGEFVYVHAWSH